MKKTLWKFLSENAFSVTLNANDTFGWACADSVDVDLYDVPKLQEIEEKYGHCGVIAFMAKVRGYDPIEPRRTEKYWAAKKELKSYTLLEDLSPDDKEAWNKWWKKYYERTGEGKDEILV